MNRVKLLPALGLLLSGMLLSAPSSALVSPTVLDSSIQCSAGNARNGIQISDVTGNNGGATDCWGTLDGNDPGPGGQFQIGTGPDTMTYSFVAKDDGALTGQDIGLSVTGKGTTSGTWAFDPTKFDPDEFLIVLKAASSPGYGVWLFSGTDATSFSGDWFVAWGRGLSHLSVYVKDDPNGGNNVSEGSTLGLFALSGLGVVAMRRRRKK